MMLAVLSLLFGSPASAEIFRFGCITNNAPEDCSILQAQLRMEVTGGTIGTADVVNFTFTNTGSANSSITDIYFSDLSGLLSTPMYINGGPGVSFSAGCSPGGLPGGQDYNFTTSYCADSTNPTQPMGVNPGEWLTISYTLQGGATQSDVLAAFPVGGYRVGVHVQGFASEGSESAVALPEASSLLFLAAGAFLVPLLRRFRPLGSF